MQYSLEEYFNRFAEDLIDYLDDTNYSKDPEFYIKLNIIKNCLIVIKSNFNDWDLLKENMIVIKTIVRPMPRVFSLMTRKISALLYACELRKWPPKAATGRRYGTRGSKRTSD